MKKTPKKPSIYKRQVALRRAIQNAGGPKLLAEALGITCGAVSQWSQVPIERVLEVERITKVSRHDLRPDFYPSNTAA